MGETFDIRHPAVVCSSKSYYYFSLQGEGREFYCSNSYGSAPQYTIVDDSECLPLCPGLENKPITKKNVNGIDGNDVEMTGVFCGGQWRNAVFTDDPVFGMLAHCAHSPVCAHACACARA